MFNAGTSLDKYLKANPNLSKEQRFDLAIKVCLAVHHLHQGISSRTGTPFAHRDLKPANISVRA